MIVTNWLRMLGDRLAGVRQMRRVRSRCRITRGLCGSVAPLETRVLPSAIPAGTEFRVNNTTNDSQQLSFHSRAVASDADGNSVVMWNAWDGSGVDLYAQRYDAAGVPQGTEFRLDMEKDPIQPTLAMAADGSFVITWMYNGTSGFDVYAQRFNAEGIAQGGEFLVNTTTEN